MTSQVAGKSIAHIKGISLNLLIASNLALGLTASLTEVTRVNDETQQHLDEAEAMTRNQKSTGLMEPERN